MGPNTRYLGGGLSGKRFRRPHGAGFFSNLWKRIGATVKGLSPKVGSLLTKGLKAGLNAGLNAAGVDEKTSKKITSTLANKKLITGVVDAGIRTVDKKYQKRKAVKRAKKAAADSDDDDAELYDTPLAGYAPPPPSDAPPVRPNTTDQLRAAMQSYNTDPVGDADATGWGIRKLLKTSPMYKGRGIRHA